MNFEATVQREPVTVLRCDLEYSMRIEAVGDCYGVGMLLSKEHAELLRDTLDVFLGGGYADE